jgi:hypothetical protein
MKVELVRIEGHRALWLTSSRGVRVLQWRSLIYPLRYIRIRYRLRASTRT